MVRRLGCRRCGSERGAARASCWTATAGRSTTRLVRVAAPDEVARWLERVRPARAALDVGELALAPGVPFELDAGGFGRHTFLCGQSGSGKTYSLGVLLERLLMETELRVVVLDPNSDYVRLGEARDGADAAARERFAPVAGTRSR